LNPTRKKARKLEANPAKPTNFKGLSFAD